MKQKSLGAQMYATVASQISAGMRSGCAPVVLPSLFSFSLQFLIKETEDGRESYQTPVGLTDLECKQIGTVEQDASIYLVVQTQHLFVVVEFSSRRVTKILLPALEGRSYAYQLNAALSKVIEKGEQSLLLVEADTAPSILLDSYLPDLYLFPLV